MIQIWQVPSECSPSNLVVLALLHQNEMASLDADLIAQNDDLHKVGWIELL